MYLHYINHDKNLQLIQPLLQELYDFLCFWFWPPGGQAKDQTEPRFDMRDIKFRENSSQLVFQYLIWPKFDRNVGGV
jgi:hypothetical protein